MNVQMHASLLLQKAKTTGMLLNYGLMPVLPVPRLWTNMEVYIARLVLTVAGNVLKPAVLLLRKE